MDLTRDGYVIREESGRDAAVLAAIGRLRIDVWQGEGSLAPEIVRSGAWLDERDPECSHWNAYDPAGALVASGRLSLHQRLEDSLDGYVWTDAGRAVPSPFASISRLVVVSTARGRGLAGAINCARVEAARERGARAVTVTASTANARLLAQLGFVDTGLVVSFANRPGVTFHALDLVF